MYNSDNISRVRRDEEAAREREHAEEQRLQAIDAERRLAILRGEVPPPLPPSEDANQEVRSERRRDRDDAGASGRERKKRKRHGEDDTDFEMRLAQDRASGHASSHTEGSTGQAVMPHKSSDAPLTDATGHIDLFGGLSSSTRDTRKNAEAEAEKDRKKREYEDQYRMRFSNAAGFQAAAAGPWYAPASGHKRNDAGEAVGDREQGKDAFGRPDPGRIDRDAARIEANDPLAMMRKGAAKAREVEKERRSLNEEREKEIRRLRREERRIEKRRHRRDDRNGDESVDDLEGFSLDRHDKTREERHKRDDYERHRKRPRERHYHHHDRQRGSHKSLPETSSRRRERES